MNRNFCFGFTSPDDRLPIGKSGYAYILKHLPPRYQPPSFSLTPAEQSSIQQKSLKSEQVKFSCYLVSVLRPPIIDWAAARRAIGMRYGEQDT